MLYAEEEGEEGGGKKAEELPNTENVKSNSPEEDKKLNQLLDKEYNRWINMSKTEYVSELKKTLKTRENIRNYYAFLVDSSNDWRWKEKRIQAFDNLPTDLKRLEKIRWLFRTIRSDNNLATYGVGSLPALFLLGVGYLSEKRSLQISGVLASFLPYLLNKYISKPGLNKTVKQLIHTSPNAQQKFSK